MPAKFFKQTDGQYGLRQSGSPIDTPIPAGSEIVEFDETENPDLIDSLSGRMPGTLWQDHAIVGGVLQRKGVPVAINPPRVLTDVELLRKETVALALLVLDEFNRFSTEWRYFKTATAAATSLADLQTRVAALPNMPDRTQRQLLDAVRDKLTTLG